MIAISSVEYRASGRVFTGRLVSDDVSRAGSRPGVLVFHGGAGAGPHEEERARRLAEAGYVALVPDLFGQKFEDRAQGMSVITELVAAPEVLRERTNAALHCLRAHGADPKRTAAIGFCFGGLAVLELARSGADVAAVVSFHGGLTARIPARPGEVTCSILACTGAADPFVTREHRAAFEDEMTAANVAWEMIVHGGALHGFTEPGLVPGKTPGVGYDAQADRRSWQAMQALFEETMGVR